jgi:hypothetical protein
VEEILEIGPKEELNEPLEMATQQLLGGTRRRGSTETECTTRIACRGRMISRKRNRTYSKALEWCAALP